MAAYRHLLPPMPPTNRIYGAGPNDHLQQTPSVRPYDDHGHNTVLTGQTNPNSIMMNNHPSVHPPTPPAAHHNLQPPTSQHQQPQQQYYHQQGMHLHNHHHTANHHPLSYQQFSVGGQHVNLARHLLATGQAHQQAMHNNNAMKGMIYHGGMRSNVVPLNASK